MAIPYLKLRVVARFAVVLAFVLGLSTTGLVYALPYGSGSYGTCQYNSCSISLSTNGTVSVNIIPGTGTTCSVASDSAQVGTEASTGYTLSFSDNDTSNQMSGAAHGGNISATSGSAATPVALLAGKWGYRVDGIAGFGAGPTTSLSSGSVPSEHYAAVPLSSGTPDTLATTTSAASPAVTTTVWYGVCVSSSTVSDTYSDGVVYTAVTN